MTPPVSLRCPDCKLPIDAFSCPACNRKFSLESKPYKDFLPLADQTRRKTEFSQMPEQHEKDKELVGAQRLLSEYDYNIERTNLRLVTHVGISIGLRVLEIGPGRGYFCSLFTKKYPGNSYSVVEYEQTNLDYGLRVGYFQSASFLALGSVYALPFEDQQFDLVIISEVLEHLDDLDIAMAEIRRVLKLNGWIIASVPNSILYFYPYPIIVRLLQSVHHLGERNDKKGFRLLVRRIHRLADDNFEGVYHRPFLPSQFCGLFKKSGFRLVKHASSMLTYFWYPFLSTFVTANPKSRFRILMAKTTIRISDNLLQGRLPLLRYAGIRQHILARKCIQPSTK